MPRPRAHVQKPSPLQAHGLQPIGQKKGLPGVAGMEEFHPGVEVHRDATFPILFL